MRGAAAAAAVALLISTWPGAARAYRPFDGTDAAVAAAGEVELELGPLGYLREGIDRFIVAPAVVLNFGIARGWEVVLQGNGERNLSTGQWSAVDNGAFLKSVLREGVLQDKPGPSIATEFGVLLPGIEDQHGTGASVGGIVSDRWPALTVHVNLAVALTREHHGDVFAGTIFEGPAAWPVRPVAEVFYERDSTGLETTSGLAGAIWQVRDTLSFDVGYRRARQGDQNVNEIRAGLTWSFSALD